MATNINEEEEQAKLARAVGDSNPAVDASERAGFDSLATTGIHHAAVNTDRGIHQAIADIESKAELIQEAQSDDDSVRYLASTSYACDGAAGFFQKILDQGEGVRIPEFLSDHPEPAARVSAIGATAQELGCSTSLGNSSQWEAFKASLPPPAEKGDETNAESETAEDKS